VHVDKLWEDFAAMLASRFQRPVFIFFRRDGDEHSRAVQSEADFDDLCEYLDVKQLQTLPVVVGPYILEEARNTAAIGQWMGPIRWGRRGSVAQGGSQS